MKIREWMKSSCILLAATVESINTPWKQIQFFLLVAFFQYVGFCGKIKSFDQLFSFITQSLNNTRMRTKDVFSVACKIIMRRTRQAPKPQWDTWHPTRVQWTLIDLFVIRSSTCSNVLVNMTKQEAHKKQLLILSPIFSYNPKLAKKNLCLSLSNYIILRFLRLIIRLVFLIQSCCSNTLPGLYSIFQL